MQSQTRPRLPSTCPGKVLRYQPSFGRMFIIKLWPPIGARLVYGVGRGLYWGLKVVPIEMLTPAFYSTSILAMGLSCTVGPQYRTRLIDRRHAGNPVAFCLRSLLLGRNSVVEIDFHIYQNCLLLQTTGT